MTDPNKGFPDQYCGGFVEQRLSRGKTGHLSPNLSQRMGARTLARQFGFILWQDSSF